MQTSHVLLAALLCVWEIDGVFMCACTVCDSIPFQVLGAYDTTCVYVHVVC